MGLHQVSLSQVRLALCQIGITNIVESLHRIGCQRQGLSKISSRQFEAAQLIIRDGHRVQHPNRVWLLQQRPLQHFKRESDSAVLQVGLSEFVYVALGRPGHAEFYPRQGRIRGSRHGDGAVFVDAYLFVREAAPQCAVLLGDLGNGVIGQCLLAYEKTEGVGSQRGDGNGGGQRASAQNERRQNKSKAGRHSPRGLEGEACFGGRAGLGSFDRHRMSSSPIDDVKNLAKSRNKSAAHAVRIRISRRLRTDRDAATNPQENRCHGGADLCVRPCGLMIFVFHDNSSFLYISLSTRAEGGHQNSYDPDHSRNHEHRHQCRQNAQNERYRQFYRQHVGFLFGPHDSFVAHLGGMDA